MRCGNDVLNLKGEVNPIPEPLTLYLIDSSIFTKA
jgi:hypothetical protein